MIPSEPPDPLTPLAQPPSVTPATRGRGKARGRREGGEGKEGGEAKEGGKRG